jgi:hypothetical protein
MPTAPPKFEGSVALGGLKGIGKPLTNAVYEWAKIAGSTRVYCLITVKLYDQVAEPSRVILPQADLITVGRCKLRELDRS